MREIEQIFSDALENHEKNKNKDLSSTICEFVSLECTPQVLYKIPIYYYFFLSIGSCSKRYILYYKHHCSHKLNYGIFTNSNNNKEKIRKLSTSYRHG